MSVYNYDVPFTSNLQMWSPSPSLTTEYNFNATSTMPYNSNTQDFQSRFFHHEPVLYPSACIICGLPHHPVPHTVMQYHPTVSPAITTPAPTELKQPAATKSIRRRRSTRRQLKTHKRIALQLKYITKKFMRILALIAKAPLSTRRHNIYPVKRDRVD